MKINIRLTLSSVTGSDEKIIEQIEQAIKDRNPFGLAGPVAKVVFLPSRLKAFNCPTNGSEWTELLYNDMDDFITGVKLAYIGHKEWISTDELLGIAKLITHVKQRKREKYELYKIANQNKSLGLLSGKVLPQPGQQTGPLDDGAN